MPYNFKCLHLFFVCFLQGSAQIEIHGIIGVQHHYGKAEKNSSLSLVFYITLQCEKQNSHSLVNRSTSGQHSVIESASNAAQSESKSTKESAEVRWFALDQLEDLAKSEGTPVRADVLKWLAKIKQGAVKFIFCLLEQNVDGNSVRVMTTESDILSAGL